MAKITVSAAIKALLSAANEAAARIALGLGNVNNTSDANKPVSTATQTALDAKAPLASPALTGVPTAPTAAAGTSTTQVATTAFVATALGSLVDSAPGALDTLNELAAALGDDANFAGTVAASLAAKAPLASPALTGVPTAPTATSGTSTTQIATTAFVAGEIAAKAIRFDAVQALSSGQITQARANLGIGFGWAFGGVDANSSIWVGSGRFFVHNGPSGQELYLDPTGRRVTYNSVASKNAHLVFPEVGVLDAEPTFTLRLAGGTFAFLSGEQTFSEQQTFSTSPISTGTPTLGTHILNRDQADARYGTTSPLRPGGAAYLDTMLRTGSSGSFWVAGDSTGNASDEWVGLFASWLATRHPAHRVLMRTRVSGAWSDTTIQDPGNGPRRLRWTTSGSTVAYDIREVVIPNFETSDLDICYGVAADSWAGIQANMQLTAGSGGAPDWQLRLIDASGNIRVRFRYNTTAGKVAADSTANVVTVDGQALWIRVNLDRDNGASGRTMTFYTSTDGATWTQLGDPIVVATVPTLVPPVSGWALTPMNNTTVHGVRIRTSPTGAIYNDQALDHLMYKSGTFDAGTTYLGDPELIVYNASISGRTTAGQVADVATYDAMEIHGTAFVMLSTSHNDSYAGGGDPTDGIGWLEDGVRVLLNRMTARCPMAVPVLIGQSPKLIPTSSFGRRHALRIAQAAGWCARNNIAFVNVHRAFMDAGVPLSDLVDPDLTHPTTAGNIVWGNAIINSYLNGEF